MTDKLSKKKKQEIINNSFDQGIELRRRFNVWIKKFLHIKVDNK